MKTITKLSSGLLALALTAACSPQNSAPRADEAQAGSGIIGGVDVEANSALARSVVGIYDLKIKALCTGTLIGDNMVLSAAHCVSDDTSNMVIVFNIDFQKAKKEDVRPVVGAVISPLYKAAHPTGRDTGDISIIRYAGDTPNNYSALPILPARYVSLFREGMLTLLAGYGLNDGVNKKGSGLLRSVGVRISHPQFSQTEVRFDQTQGKGACHGDSGGPAILIVGNQPYVWGVTSRGSDDPDDHCGAGAIYTNAAAYGEFIQQARTHLSQLRVNPQFQIIGR